MSKNEKFVKEKLKDFLRSLYENIDSENENNNQIN